MHGGSPTKKEVYGYTGWNDKGGFISFHNPSSEIKNYKVTLNRNLGLTSSNHAYSVTSPLQNGNNMNGKKIKFDDVLEISLKPGEVKVLDFK